MAFARARFNKAFSLTSFLRNAWTSELLFQYVIVFTSCFVSECYEFQLFFFSFLMLGPALWIVIYRSNSFKKARIIADIEASKIIETDTFFR